MNAMHIKLPRCDTVLCNSDNEKPLWTLVTSSSRCLTLNSVSVYVLYNNGAYCIYIHAWMLGFPNLMVNRKVCGIYTMITISATFLVPQMVSF